MSDGGEWLASCLSLFIPRETAPGTHRVGGRVGSSQFGCCGEKKNLLIQPDIKPQYSKWGKWEIDAHF